MGVNEANPVKGERIPKGLATEAMQQFPIAFVMTDPRQDDNPIVYVNQAFTKLTGYSLEASVGRNCRFLQGAKTDPRGVATISDALAAREQCMVEIVNYRANGDEFVNQLTIAPIFDDQGEVEYFLGVQTELGEERKYELRAAHLDESLRELQHRVKNHLQMLLALIRMESRKEDPRDALATLANRVETLSLLYQEFSISDVADHNEAIALGAYVSRVCSALNLLDGQRDVIVNIDADPIQMSIEDAARIGLLTSELLTNALQHAFREGHGGKVVVRLAREDDRLLLSVTDDGHGMPEGSQWPDEGNLGARVVRDLVLRLDAKIGVERLDKGTRISIRMPI